MKKTQCKEGLDIYKKFLTRMTRISEFLKVAEVTVKRASYVLSKCINEMYSRCRCYLARKWKSTLIV